MSKKIIVVYLVISSMLILNVVCYLNWGVSLRGYLTDRFLFWVWFTLTVFLTIRYWKKTIVRRSFYGLVVLTILSMIPMMIPFLAISLAVTGEDVGCSQELSSTIRIEEHSKGPLAIPRIEVIQKMGFAEKVIGEQVDEFEVNDDYYRMCEANSIELKESSEEEIIILFSFNDGSYEWTL